MFIYAHRGSKGTHPENTIAAFKEAVRIGAPGIEFDVHLSKDGEVVVIHDETLERTTTGNGLVKEYSLKQLKEVDAGVKFDKKYEGERIPTLEEVLDYLRTTTVRINIELKNDVYPYDGLEEKVVCLVDKYNLSDRVIFSSFNHRSIEELKLIAPHVDRAYLYDTYDETVVQEALKLNAQCIHLNGTYITKDILDEAHKYHLYVGVYTVNDNEHIQLANRLGVDGIFTDFPERALQLRESK